MKRLREDQIDCGSSSECSSLDEDHMIFVVDHKDNNLLGVQRIMM